MQARQDPESWHVTFPRESPMPAGLVEAGRFVLHTSRHKLGPHVHTPGRFEVCFVEHGRHRDAVNGRIYLVRKGQGLVVRPGDTHGSIDVSQEPVRVSFLVLDVPSPRGRFLGLPGAAARRLQNDLLAIDPPCFPFSPLAVELWLAVLTESRAVSTPAAHGIPAGRNLAVYLPALLRAVVESSRQHGRDGATNLVRRVDRFIDGQLDQRVTVAALARAVRLSASHFKARFTRETGLSPINYVMRRKMEAAKARLAGSDQTVTGMALDLGFSSSQNFATAFRRLDGRTPSSYRAYHRSS